jgi:hypothetical protein
MICKCGHLKEEHNFFSNGYDNFCDVCYRLVIGKPIGTNCYNYTPDNLRYLEELSNGRE